MMPRVVFEVSGASERALELATIDRRLDGFPSRDLLTLVGEFLASAMQDNLESEGRRLADRGIQWPPLAPATRKIRRFYRWGDGPKLVRDGTLLHSIRILEVGPDGVAVGSRLPYAGAVHYGGTITDRRSGARRQIQAFPFALPSASDLDDLELLILDFVDGILEGGAA